MSEIDIEARDRFYAEVSLKLSKAGFAPQPQEDGYLPIDWNGSRLCRLNSKDGVLYKDEDVERSGGGEALDRVIDIAGTTAEYMRCLESESALHAEKLGDGYTLLSEYNGIVFAAKANRQFGCEFVTWERTYDNKGVTVRHYIGDYQSAKQDFAVRAGLVPWIGTADLLTWIIGGKRLNKAGGRPDGSTASTPSERYLRTGKQWPAFLRAIRRDGTRPSRICAAFFQPIWRPSSAVWMRSSTSATCPGSRIRCRTGFWSGCSRRWAVDRTISSTLLSFIGGIFGVSMKL